MKTLNIIALLSAVSFSAFATDYSTMTITQLQALRGSVPTADLVAFQSAAQTKVLALSLTERQALRSSVIPQSNLASCSTTGVQTKQTIPVQQGYFRGGRIR
ncbi:MAG: hypothetical protein Q7S59_08225 [Sulfurimonas sp.]|nr:hypothetical protein [Sulfurimonas sp.]